MTDSEVLKHSKAIINSSRARNKFVFLCEGEISAVIKNNSYNPSALRLLEHLQDSSFYKKCLNSDIQKFRLPIFVNCGGRSDVIKVYNKITDLINSGEDSFVKIESLYAILDLDLQKANINGGESTEDIFHKLYNDTNIDELKIPDTKIIVTGLIHKEAYFFMSKFHEIILNYKLNLKYDNKELNLKNICKDIFYDFNKDLDLKNNLTTAINRFPGNSLTTLKDLKEFCKMKIKQEKNYKYLFTVRKIKPYWEKITNDEIDNERLREQLSLEIAQKISEDNDKNCHITAIFNNIIK